MILQRCVVDDLLLGKCVEVLMQNGGHFAALKLFQSWPKHGGTSLGLHDPVQLLLDDGKSASTAMRLSTSATSVISPAKDFLAARQMSIGFRALRQYKKLSFKDSSK